MKSIFSKVFLFSYLAILVGVKSITFASDVYQTVHTYYSPAESSALAQKSKNSSPSQSKINHVNDQNPFAQFVFLAEEYFSEKSLEDNQDDVDEIVVSTSCFAFFQPFPGFKSYSIFSLPIEQSRTLYLLNCAFLL